MYEALAVLILGFPNNSEFFHLKNLKKPTRTTLDMFTNMYVSVSIRGFLILIAVLQT